MMHIELIGTHVLLIIIPAYKKRLSNRSNYAKANFRRKKGLKPINKGRFTRATFSFAQRLPITLI
jgi:hypothetical protein